jgi:glycogen debranching enzyme
MSTITDEVGADMLTGYGLKTESDNDKVFIFSAGR